MFNGGAYATDGRIAVRIPTDNADSEGNNERRRKDVEKLFVENENANHEFAPWPPMPAEPLEQECPQCNGSGAQLISCDNCDDGYRECRECGHEGTCEQCNGSGKVYAPNTICVLCDGKRKISMPKNQRVGELIVAAYNVYRITRLPNVRYVLNHEMPCDYVCFVFDGGGQGIVMKTNDAEGA